jgi:S-adenosylmethionine decarboxylase
VNALGRHVLAEMYVCDPRALDDVETVRDIMVGAAIKAGAEVREVAFHKFNPQGVSGVVVISESHLAVHTWPEFGYAAVDVFTCGDKVDPWDAVNAIADSFRSKQVTASEIKRGVIIDVGKERVAAG